MDDGKSLARALRRAYFAMHRRTNAILARHGVTADQFVLLSRLADEDELTQRELSRRSASDANTVGPMLLLLEKRGLVERRAHASDRRARCVLLTAQGRRQVRQMMGDTETCRRQMLSAIRGLDANTIVQNLTRIAEALEGPSQD